MTIKIAENLQLLRKEKGMTQEEIAAVFGVTSQSISKWELGLSCPDITQLPKIAEYYKISVDELLGYKPMSSINSIYVQMKGLIDNTLDFNDKQDISYRLAKLAATLVWQKEQDVANKIISGKMPKSLSYGQRHNGLSVNYTNTLFIANFKNWPSYDVTTVRKVYKYLNKLSNFNTLKVLFALFDLMIESGMSKSWSAIEIAKKAKVDEDDVFKAFNYLDIYFDKEAYEKDNIETYSLSHYEQVPMLVTLLVPLICGGEYENF